MNAAVCSHPGCPRWSLFYTTLDENPKPWPTEEDPDWPFQREQVPLWYACQHHKTDKHKRIVGDQPPVCEYCGNTGGITWVGPRTVFPRKVSVWQWAYFGLEGPPTPKRASAYCADCGVLDREYWDEMWAEHNASRF